MKLGLPVYILGGAIIAVLIAYIVLTKRIKKTEDDIIKSADRGRSLKGIFWMYRIFSQTPVLKPFFKKIRNRLEIVYPADEMSIRRQATITMARGLGISIGIILLIIIFGHDDPFYMLLGCTLVYFFFSQYVTMTQDKYEDKILHQLGDFITDVRHYYSACGNVEDAIYDSLDQTPYEIGLHINRIYRILTSTNVSREVDKYTDIAPNRFVLTFVAICASIKEYGDKELDNGESLFLKNINYLKEELNVELIKKQRTNFLFSGLTTLTLIPMFFLKIIEKWATGNIPDMASFYQGSSGTVVLASTFIVTLIVYQLITNLKDGHSDDLREHKIINKILSIKAIDRIVTITINKDYTKNLRYDDNLKMVGDRIGIKGFYVKRLLFGLAALIIVNSIAIAADIKNKDIQKHNFVEEYTSSIVPNESYRETMRDMTEDYVATFRKLDDTEENRQLVREQIKEDTGFHPLLVNEMVNVIFERTVKLRNIYYKWYYLLLSIIGFFAGYFLPLGLLYYQLSIVKMDMEDEVVQYQTIVLILMHVDGIMVDTVLEWMERFAYCFKESISEALINLEYSTQKALTKMKFQETFAPFRRFVDNLLMVDNEDIITAFAEIEVDREYYKEKRKQDNEITATKKSEIGKLVAFIPLICTLLLDLIVPIAIYAYKMITTVGG